ncbi:hypothetical protein KY363_04695 [Candidatus Woesearchaeota archaeon]|nr:hypothetical protein [Candidatus Woesearchaeota archaeon]
MKSTIFAGIALIILTLILAGCAAPQCYPPNKIIDNKCCLDEDANAVCDYEEGKTSTQTKKTETTEQTTVSAAPDTTEETTVETEEEEPQIQTIKAPTATYPVVKQGYTFGVQKIGPYEPQKMLEINDLSAFRTSRDKGTMDWMVFTVRNRDSTKANYIVELLFEGARIEGTEVSVKKEYTIPALALGEKYVVNQSLGIGLSKINSTKKMTLSVYEKYTAPRKNLDTITKNVVPVDYMDDLEIYTYGIPE